jgi:hypothetical protein
MPNVHARMAAVLSIIADQASSTLQVSMRDDDNTVYQLDLPDGLVGGLIVSLISQIQHLRPSGVAQPMTLNSGRSFALPDGRIGLELLLENAVRLPVLFPKEAIGALRDTLEELERLSQSAPAEARRH